MFQRIRRSFRKKKASHCFNCGHTSKACYHQEYENINLNQQSKSDHLKWLDLDANNDLKLQQQFSQLRQRPHSVYNEYTNMPFGDITVIIIRRKQIFTPQIVSTKIPLSLVRWSL